MGRHVRWWFALLTVMALTFTGARAQSESASEYVAFRIDDRRLLATVLIRESTPPQIRDGLSPPPVARFGYSYFTVPPWWQDRPFVVPSPGPWSVHLSPGSLIGATAEQVVGGYVACQEAVGVILRVDPNDSELLARSRARYFVASPFSAIDRPTAASSPVGTLRAPVSAEWQASIEALLDSLLARELPRVRSEAAQALSTMETSTVGYHRSWARERRRVEAAMERNEGRRQYDVQAFQLGPGAPVYFVRAEWLVQGRQGFAASLWLRTEPAVEVIETNVRPASWLRMFEFQGRVTREHLGMVLNVLDRDQDGWGEVLFLESGYEGFRISLRRYSPAGFVTSGPSYGGGC